jgi:antitoxin (DNA-binding transcriptional repressor) of toxin-antitoxin stability system
MDYLQFSKLSSSTKEYMEEVEKGKSYVIIRDGKAIAKVIPCKEPVQGWKTEFTPVKLKSGVDSSKYIREERDAR